MMRKRLLSMVVLITVCLMSGSAYAVDRDAEIVAFTKKTIAHLENVGRKQAEKDFANRNGDFIKGEVYVVIMDLDGFTTYNPINSRLVGKNFMNFRDHNGKQFMYELIQNLKRSGDSWIEYHFVNPVTKKIAKKRAFAKMINKKEFSLIGYWP